MLGLVDALIYREAPFPQAEELVLLSRTTPRFQTQEFAAIEFLELQNQLGPENRVTAFSRHEAALSETDRPPENIHYVTSSPELWSTLRVSPQLGRPFTAADAVGEQSRVVVISHSYWQRRFGGDPDIIGHAVQLGGEPVTIIGVMPPEFEWAKLWGLTSLWRPLALSAAAELTRQDQNLTVLARRSPAPSARKFETALETLATDQRANHPQHYTTPFRYEAKPIQLALTHRLTGQFAWLLTALAGFILLIACANLANLQLARSSERTKEFAIRLALGSSRGHLLRDQLREPLFLSAVGGFLGLFVAMGFNHVIASRLRVRGSTSPLDLDINPPLIGAALGIALVAGLAFGLVPAWASTRIDPNIALKSQGRGASGGRHSHRLRNGLVIAEIALALTLLSGAATMQRSFTAFLTQSPGWDADQVVSANLPISSSHYPTTEARLQLFDLLEREIPQMPGVTEATLSTSTPTLGYTSPRLVFSEGQNPHETTTHSRALHVAVSPRYFATLGIPVRQGRSFSPHLARSDPPEVMINASLARHLWPGTNPVGQLLGSLNQGEPSWAKVIGVVNNVGSPASLTEPETPFTVYKPIVHEVWNWVQLSLRSPQPAAQIEPLRRKLRELAPGLVIGEVATPDLVVDRTLHNLRIATQVLSLFGLLGLGLATIGIYGVVSHLVARQTREIGIRAALGAQPRDIFGFVFRQIAVSVGSGVVLGLIGGFALNAILHRLIPRFMVIDLLPLIGVAVFLALVAVLASLLPARRAIKVDPVVALRDD